MSQKTSTKSFLIHQWTKLKRAAACTVRANSTFNHILIKKEIPGPDTIDEFLYEIEVLNELRGSKNVIDFHGLVVDDDTKIIKGLLISFASLGALVDVIYDYKLSSSLPWHRRERWAYQIIRGLSEIHEAGFVQGDCTFSNIVSWAWCFGHWRSKTTSLNMLKEQALGRCHESQHRMYQIGSRISWTCA